jgi:putative ABC transport system substrate-binding protein
MGFKGRRDVLRRLGALAAAAVASMPAAAPAQSARRLAIFHWLDPKEFEREYPGLFAALAEKGWKEGVNLTLDWREVRVDNPDLDAIAARLVATAPDVIFTESTRATRALQAATRTIPIVTSVGDPVATGSCRTSSASCTCSPPP